MARTNVANADTVCPSEHKVGQMNDIDHGLKRLTLSAPAVTGNKSKRGKHEPIGQYSKKEKLPA